jgi:lytic murein transglycosylase
MISPSLRRNIYHGIAMPNGSIPVQAGNGPPSPPPRAEEGQPALNPVRNREVIMTSIRISSLLIASLFCLTLAVPSRAAPCGGDFEAWLDGVEQEAAAQGISQRAIAESLNGVTPDPAVISRDHHQGVFTQTFEQFSGRMISPDRMRKGTAILTRQAALFDRIERQFGVPGPVLVAIWAMETDFGVNQGKFSIIRSVATLAWDCRRPDKFRAELFDTLRIVDRGDMTPAELRGDWAGEIGQTQFLPSSYLKYGVDFDGNGRRDLIHSSADALASTANYLRGYGWRPGEGWDEGSPNFAVILEWNKAKVYARTIALFADRLAAATQ